MQGNGKTKHGNPLEETSCMWFSFPYFLIKNNHATDHRYSCNRNSISPLIICGVYREKTKPFSSDSVCKGSFRNSWRTSLRNQISGIQTNTGNNQPV
jgi:hypothetical protein